MITLFTTAKPFTGHNGVIQRNALKSWTLLHPDVQVILFGDEEGAAETAREFSIRHIPQVERTPEGTKVLRSFFDPAQCMVRHELLCYLNCDIVLTPDFVKALSLVHGEHRKFLMVGRRWDTDVTCPINFQEAGWQKHLRELAITSGRQRNADFIDFFVFPRVLYEQVPPLVVGRSYRDHWLVWKALFLGVPVVDCSRFLVAVHQNHGYAYHPLRKQGTNEDELAQRNMQLCAHGKHLRSLHDATHAMTKSGRIIWTPLRRQWNTLCELRHKQGFVEHTFQLRKRLRLRRETLNKLRDRKVHARD